METITVTITGALGAALLFTGLPLILVTLPGIGYVSYKTIESCYLQQA